MPRQIASLAENQNVLHSGKSQTRSRTVLNDLKLLHLDNIISKMSYYQAILVPINLSDHLLQLFISVGYKTKATFRSLKL